MSRRAAATQPGIAHIVVLMMENHSYDNLLGMLGRGDGFTLGANGLPTAARCSTSGPGTIPPPGSITG